MPMIGIAGSGTGALIEMNFSSPHQLAPACTFRSLIQETTVCPPSRGLFFVCEFAIRDSLKVSSSNKKPAPFRDAGFAVQHQFNSLPGSESPPPVVALWRARAVPASLARKTPAPSVNTPAIRRSRPRRCGTCSATLAIPVWCHR